MLVLLLYYYVLCCAFSAAHSTSDELFQCVCVSLSLSRSLHKFICRVLCVYGIVYVMHRTVATVFFGVKCSNMRLTYLSWHWYAFQLKNNLFHLWLIMKDAFIRCGFVSILQVFRASFALQIDTTTTLCILMMSLYDCSCCCCCGVFFHSSLPFTSYNCLMPVLELLAFNYNIFPTVRHIQDMGERERQAAVWIKHTTEIHNWFSWLHRYKMTASF